jgi:hypothetical protein
MNRRGAETHYSAQRLKEISFGIIRSLRLCASAVPTCEQKGAHAEA